MMMAQPKNQQMGQRRIDQQPIGKYLEMRRAPAGLVKSSNIVVARFSDLLRTSWMLISDTRKDCCLAVNAFGLVRRGR